MSDHVLDASHSYESGYSTPPLSPTKTISTDGWLSPRTPCSPRKAQSCLFIRDIDYAPNLYLTPPSSPTKSRSPIKNNHLYQLECSPPTCWTDPLETSTQHAEAEPSKQSNHAVATAGSQGLHSKTLDDQIVLGRHEALASQRHEFTFDLNSSQIRTSLDESPISSDGIPSLSARCVTLDSHTPLPVSPVATNGHSLTQESALPSNAHCPPRRTTTSPLRSSQWSARGGLVSSPPRGLNFAADRFIGFRRPFACTRDSFELNKPEERLGIQTAAAMHNGYSSRDPFSQRLRRSARLDDELLGLRQAHAAIVARSNVHRRNTNLTYRRHSNTDEMRQVSAGAVWNVGGSSAVSDTVVGVSNGRGGMLGSGTVAPLYRSAFLDRADPEAELEAYERRLALALDVDQTERVLHHSPHAEPKAVALAKHVWRDNSWTKDGETSFLDAPQLRDDYYCTLLAFSHTAKCLAVGLGNYVHIWSEHAGVKTPESLNSVSHESVDEVRHITSLDFSSTQGGQAILAVGRADGRILLWSPFDIEPRFDAIQPKPISCVSWRPTTVQRPSLRDRDLLVATEELLIGDEAGHIYFYSIEWPSEIQSSLFGWHGAMTLLARMMIHSQQICGLAWAPHGDFFASGGNDNNCFLFESRTVLQSNSSRGGNPATVGVREGPSGESIYTLSNRANPVPHLPHTAARHKWTLNAAVKAIAFCPWQRGLLAIGGGSNDRCIHFYHTRSGTCLATIDCAAQVTSLLWSHGRREIAATFGFAQPEHPYRVAVFAWPSCEQIVAVPWWDENRALCAIAYPGTSTRSVGPAGRGGESTSDEERNSYQDGCVVVATSDMAIRFHEIWGDRRCSVEGLGTNGVPGLLGGSDILEGSHGIERNGAVIR